MDKARILRLCNEIKDIATEIQERTMKDSYYLAQTIIDKVLVISAEIGAQPKTNADRIRQMTDEEELLSAIGTGCYRCAYNNGECDSGYGEGCIAGNLEWLRKEADEDAGTD